MIIKMPFLVILKENEIVGGIGVIENDFHKRKDLTPNICAFYIEEGYRNMGMAKEMLDFVCKDLWLHDKNVPHFVIMTM